jgi:hypothetical protein
MRRKRPYAVDHKPPPPIGGGIGGGGFGSLTSASAAKSLSLLRSFGPSS